MKTFGLVGYPLGHSFSAKYFKTKFDQLGITDCEYLNFEIKEIEGVHKVLTSHPNLVGFNITIPHKENIIPFLDEISAEAEAIGAVNTVKVDRSNPNKHRLIGFNTDCYGFSERIKPFLASNHHKALILGTGGAAKAVHYVLKNLGIEVLYVSRNPVGKNCISYNDLNEIAVRNFPFIINSSPLGMFPKVEQFPAIPYESLDERNYLYDLVYNPLETEFMARGREQGAIVQNGLQMLQLQAEKAWEIWNNKQSSI